MVAGSSWAINASLRTGTPIRRPFSATDSRASASAGSRPATACRSSDAHVRGVAAQKTASLRAGSELTPSTGTRPARCDTCSTVPSPPTVTTRSHPEIACRWAR